MAGKPPKTLLGESVSGILGCALLGFPLLALAAVNLGVLYIFWGTAIFGGLLCFLMVYWAFNPKQLEKDIDADLKKGEAGDFHLVGLPSLVIWLFLIASFSGWKAYGSAFLIVPSGSPLDWLAYMVDNLVRTVFLDFAEIYRLKLSPIEHAAAFWPATFVFVFRTALSVGLINLVLTAFARLRAGKRAG